MDNKMSMTSLSVITSLFGEIKIGLPDGDRKEDADYSAYLRTEEKISSLERDRECGLLFTEKPVFEVSLDGYEKAVYRKLYVMDRIATKIVRPLLQQGRLNEVMGLILPEFIPKVTPDESDDYFTKGMKRYYKANDLVSMVLPGCIGREKTCYTVLSGKMPPRKHYGRMYGRCVVDSGMYFAELMILSEIEKYLRKLKKKSPELRKEDPVYANLCLNSEKLKWCELYLLNKSDDFVDDFRQAAEALQCKFVRSVRRSAEMTANLDEESKAKCKLMYAQHYWPFFICANLTLPIKWLFLEDLPSSHYIDVFMNIRGEYKLDKQTLVYRKGLSGDYASSYEQKKNIPLYIQKGMSESLFHEFFGNVEFDEDVDLDLMKQIEKEYSALSVYFGQGKLSDYAVRFRRLGKHHASGLFFPYEKCLCVDINSPSSMGHENFHLIDFKYGELSRRYSFTEIRNFYKILVEEKVRGNEELMKRWSGKTKYNKDYYLEPTEIFARCGELYLTKIKGVSNSLVNPSGSSGFAYPSDEMFLEKVGKYFDDIFSKIKNKEDAA